MDSNDEKLEKFQKSCYELAEVESKAIIDKINNQIDEDINEEIEEYNQEIEKRYEEKLKKLEQKHNTNIFNLNNEARFKIVEKEKEAKLEIKEEIIKRIKDFKKSEDYFSFLTKNISQAIEKLNVKPTDTVKIYIVKSDFEKYKMQLQNIFKYLIETIDEVYIGGSRCENRTQKIAIDNTLRTLINEEFQKELEES